MKKQPSKMLMNPQIHNSSLSSTSQIPEVPFGEVLKGAADLMTGDVGAAGEAALGGGTTVSAYATALESLCDDPDFIESENYNKLRGIGQIPAKTGINPMIKSDKDSQI